MSIARPTLHKARTRLAHNGGMGQGRAGQGKIGCPKLQIRGFNVC